MSDLTIREETPADAAAISALTTRAFATAEHSSGMEATIVEKLRDADALSLSLVAERDGRIVGHVAVSPVTVSDGTEGWYGLGPVSVEPELQRRRIGTDLINRAADIMEKRGAEGLTVVGDEVFYTRFGFLPIPFFYHPEVPEEHFLSVRLNAADYPDGEVTYHPAFG